MLRYDYESSAVPLLGGLTVFISKRRNVIALEWLTRKQPSEKLEQGWERLCRAYYIATRLPYRMDDSVLIGNRSRNQSIQLIADLVAQAHAFFFEVAKLGSGEFLIEFNERNAQAEASCQSAEQIMDEFRADKANIETLIGRFVLDLEMAISSVYKMMIDYGKIR